MELAGDNDDLDRLIEWLTPPAPPWWPPDEPYDLHQTLIRLVPPEEFDVFDDAPALAEPEVTSANDKLVDPIEDARHPLGPPTESKGAIHQHPPTSPYGERS